ncbi:hypothetical protein Hokovirus_3_107 [Hokovirus HKV1]|uniref:Uncharacterized protein n=1 Tax=Hokovirus HKV1 TaxID=1977638 RepID=A0A1V0SGQ9_9VIRU|nr:hypothetical protein Hokovirus_3_107 [Hokovirus HKV1]
MSFNFDANKLYEQAETPIKVVAYGTMSYYYIKLIYGMIVGCVVFCIICSFLSSFGYGLANGQIDMKQVDKKKNNVSYKIGI